MTDKVRVQAGNHVVRTGWFGAYFELVVESRTENTIATRHLNGSSFDKLGRLNNFKFLDDQRKMSRLNEIDKQVKELQNEASDIYRSFPDIA